MIQMHLKFFPQSANDHFATTNHSKFDAVTFGYANGEVVIDENKGKEIVTSNSNLQDGVCFITIKNSSGAVVIHQKLIFEI